jgi:hypothetical protein
MKTPTTVYNNVTVTAARQDDAQPVGIDLNALTTNEIVIQNKLATGATSPGNGGVITMYYAFANESVLTDIANTLRPNAQEIRLGVSGRVTTTKIYTTDKVTCRARYIYVWFSHDALQSSLTLNTLVLS